MGIALHLQVPSSTGLSDWPHTAKHRCTEPVPSDYRTWRALFISITRTPANIPYRPYLINNEQAGLAVELYIRIENDPSSGIGQGSG